MSISSPSEADHGDDTTSDHPPDECIHELFEAQAEETPDAVAVELEGRELTYAELNRRANQLAHHLRSLGVGPEVLVGLCVERSLEMMVGLLGILKAGGAYVPLDPTYPRARLRFMMQDARMPLLLTQEHLVGALPAQTMPTLCLDSQWASISAESAERPASGVEPGNLAYVIYTSGSTGQPKGVLVEHRSLCNLIVAHGRPLGIQRGSRVLQFHRFGFDVATGEIFVTLTAGGTICLHERASLLPGPELVKLLRGQAIHVAEIPPSALALMPDEPVPELRVLIIGGEACPAGVKDRWAKGRRMFNAYGPTETTVTATVAECREGDGPPSIGRPLSGTRAYVLDARLSPAPIGAQGEIYIGGAGVARGYLSRPALTSERFMPDPFSPVPGARMYRTGDLARRREDGELVFIGRIDAQVKIRGFRVEPGEIEAALSAHTSVRTCAVVARENDHGTRRLVAYVVPAGAELPSSVLREHLRANLPEYMVPSAFVMLDALPVTPHGKVDRNALPAPGITRETSRDHVAPRTPVERTLVAIWEESLAIEPIGVTDDFFALGGDSLLAIQLVGVVNARLGWALPSASLFRQPTVETLAALGTASTWVGTPDTPPGGPGGLRLTAPRVIPMPPLLRRTFALCRSLGGDTTPRLPGAWLVHGTVDVARLERALQEVVARHESLRTGFELRGDEPVMVVHDEVATVLDVVDVSEGEIEAAAMACTAMFDLAHPPLVRLSLVRAPDRAVLVLDGHHILMDGQSFDVFLCDLLAAYEGTSPPSPAVQHRDHIAWLAGRGHEIDAMGAFWLAHLSPPPPALELPTDFPRPPFRDHAGRTMTPRVPAFAIQALARERRASTFMVLLAAYYAWLYRLTGQEDVVVGAIATTRDAALHGGLIWRTLNIIALRARPSGAMRFDELLDAVRSTCLAAYANVYYPFERLVERLDAARDPSRHPVHEALFSYEKPRSRAVELDGARATRIELEKRWLECDIDLEVVDQDGVLELGFTFATALFRDETMHRLSRAYVRILDVVTAHPDTRLSELCVSEHWP